MSTRMQQRRGTAAQWISTNSGNGPILAAGEIGFESDTNKFKIGDGVNHWIDLDYFTDGQSALDAVNALIDGAPAALDTLNELAAALGDDANFLSSLATTEYVDTAVSNSTVDQSGLAGTGIDWNVSTEQFDIDDTVATKTYVLTEGDAILTEHNDTTVNVHGITDTANLVYTSDAVLSGLVYTSDDRLSDERVPVDASVTEGKIATDAVTTIKIADANVTESKINSGAVTEAKIATDAVTTLKIADSNVTTDKINNAAVTADKLSSSAVTEGKIADGAVTSAKIANGTIVDSDISTIAAIAQSKVDGLVDALSSKASATELSDHSADTTSVHGIADTSILATTTGTQTLVNKTLDNPTILVGVDPTYDTISSTEIGYLDGVTSNIQSQLDAKAPLSGATFTGDVTVETDLTVDGNLIVSGTTTTVNATDLVVSDPLIYIGEGNSANLVDLGLVSSFNDGTYQHAGIVRDSSAGKWKIFKGVTDEPTTTVNFGQGSLDDLAVGALEATTVTPSSGIVFSDGTQVKVGVPSITTFATAISSSATLASGEQDKFVPLTGAVTITLPSTGYSKGQSIDFFQETGTGAQFASTNSVVGTPGLKFRTTNSVATAMKTDSGWLVFGDLSA